VLVDVVLLIGGRENLRLVNIVDANHLQDLSQHQGNPRTIIRTQVETITRFLQLACASTKWPIRTFAMTGIVTASTMDLIMAGSL
jgi:hypothetical protein